MTKKSGIIIVVLVCMVFISWVVQRQYKSTATSLSNLQSISKAVKSPDKPQVINSSFEGAKIVTTQPSSSSPKQMPGVVLDSGLNWPNFHH